MYPPLSLDVLKIGSQWSYLLFLFSKVLMDIMRDNHTGNLQQRKECKGYPVP